jgi:hypothetical protein
VIRKFYQQEWCCARALSHAAELSHGDRGHDAATGAGERAGLFECPQPGEYTGLINGVGQLDGLIRAHAGGDAGEDFPGNGAGGLGVVEGGDGLVALRAQDHHFVAGWTPGISVTSRTDWSMLMRPASGARWPRTKQAEAVAEAAVEAVGVAHGDQREAHGLGGHKGAVVADHRAGGNAAHAGDGCRLPTENRLQAMAGGGYRPAESSGGVEIRDRSSGARP